MKLNFRECANRKFIVEPILEFLIRDLENADNSSETLEYSYDCWGNPRKVSDWLDPIPVDELIADRGYTGHEHLTEFGLINMNGRVYDPKLGRFLSPDPFVQAPHTVGGFNRYTYCFNNPLKYTDPSGYVADRYDTYHGFEGAWNSVQGRYALPNLDGPGGGGYGSGLYQGVWRKMGAGGNSNPGGSFEDYYKYFINEETGEGKWVHKSDRFNISVKLLLSLPDLPFKHSIGYIDGVGDFNEYNIKKDTYLRIYENGCVVVVNENTGDVYAYTKSEFDNMIQNSHDPWWYYPFDINTTITFVLIDALGKFNGVPTGIPGLSQFGFLMNLWKSRNQLKRYYNEGDLSISPNEVYLNIIVSALITINPSTGFLGGPTYSIFRSDDYRKAIQHGYPSGFMGGQNSRVFYMIYDFDN